MATYKGKKVTARDVPETDARFDKSVPKSIITKEDGTEEVVNKSDVTP
jgi:hypothetical protein